MASALAEAIIGALFVAIGVATAVLGHLLLTPVTGVVIVVPKNRPATRAWAARFIEDAKKNGTVRRALDGAGFVNAAVAPPK